MACARFGDLSLSLSRHGKAIHATLIWTAEHCQARREYRARGLSYGEIARRLNSKFGTAYTRNAALGRGVRGQCVRRRSTVKAPEKAWCCEIASGGFRAPICQARALACGPQA